MNIKYKTMLAARCDKKSRFKLGSGLASWMLLPLMISILGCGSKESGGVVEHYADMAQAVYEDSLQQARMLDQAIKKMIDNPSKQSLEDARTAWKDARVPYMQTEVFRFGNPVVDGWEGRVNAWPLDEGLIDYVVNNNNDVNAENNLFQANVIANKEVLINGTLIDTRSISKNLISKKLHEAEGNEANVATGYHAIEFLLWGQDLNGTKKGAGDRPYTDFDLKQCTNENCDRRIDYLKTASSLLIDDLKEMVQHWSKSGKARKDLEDNGIRSILIGMGSLAFGELAGERMRLGLLLGDPEEEHDCFSDNTHMSHFYNLQGIVNVYQGRYQKLNGESLEGPSLAAMIAELDVVVDQQMRQSLDKATSQMRRLVNRANEVEAYDQMIAQGNYAGNRVVSAVIDSLASLTRSIERVIEALNASGTHNENWDSLDNPASVFE